jgi:hypothetical protein
MPPGIGYSGMPANPMKKKKPASKLKQNMMKGPTKK